MNNENWRGLLSIWSSAFLSLIGIGFTLSLQSAKPGHFIPNLKQPGVNFDFSHYAVLFSAFWVYGFVFCVLIYYLHTMKSEKLISRDFSGDILILLSICMASLTSIIFDFSTLYFVFFLCFLFIIASICFFYLVIYGLINGEMKKLGSSLFAVTLTSLIVSVLFRIQLEYNYFS